MVTTIDVISDDLLHNIVARLPATSFASAACVSRSWNLVCERLLSRPKLVSACFSDPSLEDAVDNVVNKVLSEPIRPHFAILSIGDNFDCVMDSLEEAHYLITKKLGNRIPVVTNCPLGTIGKDALSDKFEENQWVKGDECNSIILTVGYLPGMKVTTIPLELKNPVTLKINKFVNDVREFSISVSGCSSPAAMIMFGDEYRAVDFVEKMGYEMSPETVVVGDWSAQFRYTNANQDWSIAVALVFAVDMNKRHGIGETQFHAVLSSGLSPVGPTYEATSVKEKDDVMWISAKYERSQENIDGRTIVKQVDDEIGDRDYELYIGVTKKRNGPFGRMTSLAFYEVCGNNRKYFFVSAKGAKIHDKFRFYYSDSTTARASVKAISSHLKSFNRGRENTTGAGDKQEEVFGGLIFSCCGWQLFQPRLNVDSKPFRVNFPGVNFGGTFCRKVIGRGFLTPHVKESQEQKAVQCFVQAMGAIYLIMSYGQ